MILLQALYYYKRGEIREDIQLKSKHSKDKIYPLSAISGIWVWDVNLTGDSSSHLVRG